MRMLILGGTGMLGHQLWAKARQRLPVAACVRRTSAAIAARLGFPEGEAVVTEDIRDSAGIRSVLEQVAPSVVVNCMGIVKQRIGAATTEAAVVTNALVPHLLRRECRRPEARLIHISTDCVFSGQQGHYSESDRPDPVDAYGMTKLLGEVSGPRCLVIRTSMIGPEVSHHTGLLAWALAQRGQKVAGFRKARFSGLSTPELARVIMLVAREFPDMEGLVHIAGPAIDKHSLLSLINAEYQLGLEIVPTDEPVCDRSLCADRFHSLTGYVPPDWPTMIKELRSLGDAPKGETCGD